MVFLRYVSTNSDFFDYTSLEVVYDYNEVEPDSNVSAYVFKISLPITDILNDINTIKIRSYLLPPSNINKSNLYSVNCKVSNYKYIIENAEKEINIGKEVFLINEELFKGKIISVGFKLDSTISTITPKVEFNLNSIGNNNGLMFKIKPEHYLYLIFKQISISRIDTSKYNIQSIINIPINSVNTFIESLFKNITNEYKFFTRATKRINKVIYPRTSIPIMGPKKYSGRYF